MFPSIEEECEYRGTPLGTHGEVCLLIAAGQTLEASLEATVSTS